MIIDAHTHIVPEQFPDFSRRAGGAAWPRTEAIDPCSARVMVSGQNFRTITDQSWSPARRMEDMDGEQVGRQVLSPMPKLFSYEFAAADALDFCRAINETIAGMVQAAPDRFYGLGIVPLQDAELAAKSIDEVRKLGLQGVEIGTNVNGKSLGDPSLRPFFAEASAQRLPIFVHGQNPTGADRFSGAKLLENLIGFPQENTLAAATLITGGVIEQCPHARFLFSHGGGGFSLMLPRLDQGWRSMNQFLPRLPSEYAANFYFDTLLYEAQAIRHLLARFGAGRLVIGSDYPYAIREQPPGKHLAELLELSAAEREQVHSRTCLEFLGME